MPKRPDPRFPIPSPEKAENYVLDLLGGIVRRRPLTGEEALAQLNRMEEDARRGNPSAQTEFARHLLTDAPDNRKNRRALALLRKAAARKHPEALHLLGIVMLRGQGLAADPEAGAKLLEEAAYQGVAGAAADLATLPPGFRTPRLRPRRPLLAAHSRRQGARGLSARGRPHAQGRPGRPRRPQRSR